MLSGNVKMDGTNQFVCRLISRGPGWWTISERTFALGEDLSLHTYAFAESIREDAHAMSAKHRKKKGVFVNAPPLELLMVLANISVFSQVSFAEVKFGLQKFAISPGAPPAPVRLSAGQKIL